MQGDVSKRSRPTLYPARITVRLDDACPTMKSNSWAALEAVLDDAGIQPLVAVVPDNQDPDLAMGETDPEFWAKVRGWQSKGWTIGLHGHRHLLAETDHRGLVPFHSRSEFAGVNLDEQKERIRAAIGIFRRESIEPTAWVAPAHSFDENTLLALRECTDIRVVSDGIALAPFSRGSFTWVPQQLWRFRRMPFGVWTVCLHPDELTPSDLAQIRDWLKANKGMLRSFSELLADPPSVSILDMAFSLAYWAARRGPTVALRQLFDGPIRSAVAS